MFLGFKFHQKTIICLISLTAPQILHQFLICAETAINCKLRQVLMVLIMCDTFMEKHQTNLAHFLVTKLN